MLKMTTVNTIDCEGDKLISTHQQLILFLHADVADGANIASPVHNIDVHKIPATPTSTASSHHFNLGMYGAANTCTCLQITSFYMVAFIDNEITNSLAVPETRSRRNSREQKDQPNVKSVVCITTS